MGVAVIGGGITGLAAAYRLSQAGVPVTLFEKDDKLGGLAGSISVGPLSVEKYYHFICMRDLPYFDMLEELNLHDRLKWVDTKMSYYAHGRMYRFATPYDLMRFKPLSFFDRFRFGVNVLYTSRIKNWQALDRVDAKGWLLKHVGVHGWEEIWEPLMRMKFGAKAEQISAAWLWGRAKRVAHSRVKGMQQERLGYVKGGTQALIDELERRIIAAGGEILKESEVTAVRPLAGGVELKIDGQALRFESVLSTLPVPLFLKLASGLPADFLRKLKEIEYYAVACVFLKLKHHLTDNFWLNAHDERISFAGIIEYGNLNPLPELEGSSIAYVPYYLPTDADFYSLTSEQHRAHLASELKLINPDFDEGWLEYVSVFKDEYAQPICAVGHLDRMPPFKTPVERLYMAEMSQIYPEDRGVANAIDIANKATSIMIEDRRKDSSRRL